jgi:hypothetical protein
MATWQQFHEEAPEMASIAAERIADTGLVLVASLRRDGWPRISPVEPVVTDGQLYLGMMPSSMKSLDLRRDGRVLVHTTVNDKDGKDGETKIYGRAREITGADERERYCQALFALINWRPDGPFDLYAVDIVSVAWVTFANGAKYASTWSPGRAPVIVAS